VNNEQWLEVDESDKLAVIAAKEKISAALEIW